MCAEPTTEEMPGYREGEVERDDPLGPGVDILGPLKVHCDGLQIDVGPAMIRSLLGLLALHRGRIVSREEIVKALWGDDPPATYANLVHVYVSRLRAQLRGGSRLGTGRAGLVSGTHGGYRLELAAGAVDLSRFDDMCALARAASEGGDTAVAIARYEQALACWRGRLLADLDPRLGQLPAAVAADQRRKRGEIYDMP
jgi:DNA-binding SARP family transcriptional activator